MRTTLLALLIAMGVSLVSIQTTEACGRRHRRGGGGGGGEEGQGSCSSCGQQGGYAPGFVPAPETGSLGESTTFYRRQFQPRLAQPTTTLATFNQPLALPAAITYAWCPIPDSAGQYALFLGNAQIGAVDPQQGYRPFNATNNTWGKVTAAPLPTPLEAGPLAGTATGLTSIGPAPMPRK